VWDDTALVLRDPLIRSWRLIPEGFGHFLFLDAGPSDFYRPIQRLTYVWDYAWFGFAPWGYHLTNLLLHGGAAIALYIFLEKLFSITGTALRWVPAAAALAWTLHPVHSSAVDYVAGRADLVAALAGFCALIAAVLWLESKRFWTLAACGLALLIAACSKESGLMFAIVAPVLAVMLRGWRVSRPILICSVLVVALYFSLRTTASHLPPPPNNSPTSALAVRPLLAVRAVAEYAGLLIFPRNLHMERDLLPPFGRIELRDVLEIAHARELQGLLGALLLFGSILWWRWERKNSPVTALLLPLGGLLYLPVSNLLPLNANVAEHWLYLPSAFWIPAAFASITTITQTPAARRSVVALFAIWIGYLGWRAHLQTGVWKDQRTFLDATIQNGGDTPRMRLNLATHLSNHGDHAQALDQLKLVSRDRSSEHNALLSGAAIHLRLKNFDTARAMLDRVPPSPFTSPRRLELLAMISLQQGSGDPLPLLREAVRSAPSDWPLQRRLVQTLTATGDTATAIRELRAFIDAYPFRAESFELLGDLLAKTGDAIAAREAYTSATKLDVHADSAREKSASLRH
jgi:tetratricopeptide (TPR) repeat protein